MATFVLFYSDKCRHSNEFLQQLSKNPDLNGKFTKVNVSEPNARIPPYVKSVPTVLAPNNGKTDMLVGQTVFKWLESMAPKQRPNQGGGGQPTPGGIMDYDPASMSGFSDSFAGINDNNLSSDNAFDKNFSFLGRVEPSIPTDAGDMGSSGSSKKKDETSRRLEELKAQRDRDVPIPQQRLGGDSLPSY